MKTNQPASSIVDFKIRIARDLGGETDRLQIDASIWVKMSNAKIKDFSKEDLRNLTVSNNQIEVGVLSFNIIVFPGNDSGPLEKPVLIHKIFELKNGEDADFIFGEKSNFIFLTNIMTNIKPEGTKRTVITYEDTDVIDDTKR